MIAVWETRGTGTWEISGCSGRTSASPSPNSSSCSFSPARRPVYSIATGRPACADQLAGHVGDPHRLAHVEHERLAGPADRAAWMTSWHASSMVMK